MCWQRPQTCQSSRCAATRPVVVPSGDADIDSFLVLSGSPVMLVLDSRPTLEAPDDDPYLWLEEIESARALNWVGAQNAATARRFSDAGGATSPTFLRA